jgi:dTDP-glucose 4,6-dehydratase
LRPRAKKQNFLITGGGGFIGSHLCRRFLEHTVDETGLFSSSNEIICLDHLNNGHTRISDLLSKPGFRVLRPGSFIPDEINFVLHFASYPSPRDHLRMPLETLAADSHWTMEMVKFAELKKATFMLASTGHIDQIHDPTNERAIYAEGKRFAEAYTMAFYRQYQTDIRIIRMFNSYGPGMRIDDGRVVPTFIVKALKGEKLTILGGEQLISLTYIDDMLDAIEAVLYSSIREPIEIGSRERISIGSLAQMIIELSESKSEIEFKPQTVFDEREPDLTLAGRIGWEPKIDIAEGLDRTIRDFRNRL